MSKTCSGCGKTGPVDEFRKNRNQCKVCVAKWQVGYIERNREKLLKRHREYNAANKEAINKKAREVHHNNRTLNNKRSKEYRAKHKDRIALANIKSKYGLTENDIKTLLVDQQNCCKICLTEFNEVIFYNVDHCHTTGKVRGLLCRGCNWGTGNFKDNPDTLKQAIEYLEKANA